MSVLTDLQAALVTRTAEYAALAGVANHSEGGRSIDHIGNRKSLLDEIKELRLLIILEQGTQISRTQVLT